MKINMKIVLRLAVIFVSFTQITFAQTFLNLDFEKNKDGKPEGWRCMGDGFKITFDSAVFVSGKKSLCIEKSTAEGVYFSAGNRLPPEYGKGKNLVFSGYIKTDIVENGIAQLWWRVKKNGELLNFNNMYDKAPRGTTDWTKYTIELKIDDNPDEIAFGILFSGKGKVWFDKLQIELNEKIYEDLLQEKK